MTSVTVVVNDKVFKTTKETLSGSGYFRGIFELNPEERFITVDDRCDRLFGHVLNYLRDCEYPFPGKYHKEMEFYLIDNGEHTCENNECYQKAELLEKYCESTSENPTHVLHEKYHYYCSDHRCKHELCYGQVTERSYYCSEHTCNAIDCRRVVKEENGKLMRFCIKHSCHEKNCNEEARYKSIYCEGHACYEGTYVRRHDNYCNSPEWCDREQEWNRRRN